MGRLITGNFINQKQPILFIFQPIGSIVASQKSSGDERDTPTVLPHRLLLSPLDGRQILLHTSECSPLAANKADTRQDRSAPGKLALSASVQFRTP